MVIEKPQTIYTHRQDSNLLSADELQLIARLEEKHNSYTRTHKQVSIRSHLDSQQENELFEYEPTTVKYESSLYGILAYQLPESVDALQFFKDTAVSKKADFSEAKLVGGAFFSSTTGFVKTVFDYEAIEEGLTPTDRNAVSHCLRILLNAMGDLNAVTVVKKSDERLVEALKAEGFELAEEFSESAIYLKLV